MPMENGVYVAPVWVNGAAPAISAEELQAMSDTLAADPGALMNALVGDAQSASADELSWGMGIGLADVSAATGKKTALGALAQAVYDEVDGVKVAVGSFDAVAGAETKTITFPFAPKILIVVNEPYYGGKLFISPATRGAMAQITTGSGQTVLLDLWTECEISWSGNTATLGPLGYGNVGTYHWAAIG